MPLDYNSLLLAVGFAGAGLAVTMFGAWLAARTDGFLLTWAIGVALIVVHVLAYSLYVETKAPALQVAAFSLLMIGLTAVFGAARQFRGKPLPLRTMLTVAAFAFIALLVPALFGFDGLVAINANVLAASLLVATALQYWLVRAEAPLPLSVMSALYGVTGLSFVVCAIVLVSAGELTLGRAPDNWAESLNVIVAIGGITGIGALSLALNQSRLARSHRRDALTDPLTGLLNRRALFGNIGSAPLDRFTGVLVFDLDHFKTINDRFGHSVGDEVLRRFSLVMLQSLRNNDLAARLGGEEFAAILPRSTTDRAHQIAERIRKGFAELVVETDAGDLQCTVSVGIAFPAGEDRNFEQVLSDADKALYRAKNSGRNRVASASVRLAG